ncbi:MAG: hypothetical protein M3347_19090 [Armatimonadota bacterium]|nr:hypothetical protein [Armatimonadota bacterium]
MAGLKEGLTTGQFILYWASLTVLLFNTILLFWLGLIILLNVERHTWGSWLAAVGLLIGGAFFAAYIAGLDYALEDLVRGIHTWWYPSWGAVIALPFGWYLLMLWYTGFWDARQSPLHHRHRPWFFLTFLLALLLVGLVLYFSPQRVLAQVAHPSSSETGAFDKFPLLILLYPIYIVLCVSLALDALHRPEPSGRLMGDLARRRARPWLIASSLVQLLVSLLVAGMMLGVIVQAWRRGIGGLYALPGPVVDWFEFIVPTLIAISIVLLGKAVVSYEIFTGKTLPRRGFLRQWRYIVLVAAGYSLLVGWSLMQAWRPVYGLLMTAVLMSIFYALFSWRSYGEHEQYMTQLRPFVTSQHLYEHLLTYSSPVPTEHNQPVDAATPFRALCEDVLGARVAALVALGPLAPLVGPPLIYPLNTPLLLSELGKITSQFTSPKAMCISLDPTQYGGAVWAIPLWSERGLIGVLLLGEKWDGGLYTQEEIEIARASGERLIDTQASAVLAHRLMALQRQRLAESQVLDRRGRRMLHDDILPRLHTAMLALSNPQSYQDGAPQDALSLLAEVHHQISNLLREMPTTTAPEVARLGLVAALRCVVDEELGGAFDDVTWQIEPQAEQEMKNIPSLTAEVLFYAAREAMRNAARYGRHGEADRPLHLRIALLWRDGLEIVIEDDGVGLEASGSSAGGSGHGLALHSTMMAVVGGQLSTESAPGQFTRVVLTLPQD